MPSCEVPPHDGDLDVRASEERLRLATEAGRIGTYDWNLITGKAIYSETLEQIYGVAPGSLDVDPETLSRLVHPEDREFVRQTIEACLRQDLPSEIEFRIHAADGSLRWIAGRARALRDDAGNAVRLLGAAYDITDRKRTERRLAAQYAITRVLAEAGTLAAATPRILQTICRMLDWDIGVFWTVDDASDTLCCLDVWQQSGRGSEFSDVSRQLRLKRGVGFPGCAWESGEPGWLPDVWKDGNFIRASAADREGLRTAFCFPLRVGAEVIGVMEFFSRDARQPDGDLLRTFASIGGQIGQVIERMRAEEALRRSYQAERQLRQHADRARERTARLQNLTAALSEALTAEQVADIIITHALPAMEATAGVVSLLGSDAGERLSLRSVGAADAVSALPIGEAIRDRELIAIPRRPEGRDQTLVAIPMLWKGRAIGAIGLSIRGERTFDEDDRALMLAIGQQCAQALERARLYDAEQMSRTAVEASLHALQASETKFRRLVESNVIGVVFGEAATITGANQRFLDTTGYTYEDLLSGKLDWTEMTPPELRRRDERAFQEARQRRAVRPYEKEFLRKDGSRVPTLVGLASFQSDPSAPWVSVVLDLSDLKWTEKALRQSESRFHTIFDQAPVGIAEADLTGRLLLVNQKYCDIVGYTQQELLGKRFHDQTHPDDVEANVSLWERAVSGEVSGYCIEKRFVRKDGSIVWARSCVSVVRNQDSEPMYTLGIVEDITERKRMEERLRCSQKLESLGVLAGGIAHDFNNLLTGVMGNTSLVLDRTEDDKARVMLEEVLTASERASNLTRQMLAYAGKGRLLVEPIDLSDMVREVFPLLKAAVPTNVRLRLDLAADLPPIQGDASQIQQILMNLVINAAESIGNERNGTILIATALNGIDREFIHSDVAGVDVGPGRYAALKVVDDGCGMDEETRSRMFDPFFTTKFTGRGLGLAAVYGIVRGHRGAVQVLSSPGKGTVFTVLLPVSEWEASPSKPAPEPQQLRGAGTILVVEDEAVVREAARNMLDHYGYHTLLARDGEEAVDLFRRNAHEIALVLLDLTMPGMSGDKVALLLKSIRPDTPLVISSGYDESEVLKLFGGQSVDFIQKPYTAAQLAGKIKDVLLGGPGPETTASPLSQ